MTTYKLFTDDGSVISEGKVNSYTFTTEHGVLSVEIKGCETPNSSYTKATPPMYPWGTGKVPAGHPDDIDWGNLFKEFPSHKTDDLGNSAPDTKCKCPIENLFNFGHDKGCPEKK